jgi:hypothetical protein
MMAGPGGKFTLARVRSAVHSRAVIPAFVPKEMAMERMNGDVEPMLPGPGDAAHDMGGASGEAGTRRPSAARRPKPKAKSKAKAGRGARPKRAAKSRGKAKARGKARGRAKASRSKRSTRKRG